MTKDKLQYFRIAKQLNEKHREKLILKKLHFRGNLNSFSLVSVSQEFSEKGVGRLETDEKGEAILETIVLHAPKRVTPEKSLQAWIINHSLNDDQLKLPFGNYTFLTSELAHKTIEGKKIVNDILAIDDDNSLVIIEIKGERVNKVKLQAIEFETEIVRHNEGFFHELVELLLSKKWNENIRKVVVWPAAKRKARKRKYLDVDEVSYEHINNLGEYKFKCEYRNSGVADTSTRKQ